MFLLGCSTALFTSYTFWKNALRSIVSGPNVACPMESVMIYSFAAPDRILNTQQEPVPSK